IPTITIPTLPIPILSTTTTTGPSSTTTTTTSATTTTVGTCAPIVPSAAIPNTYRLDGTTGEKRCTTNSAANRFGTCNTDADCGGTSGACLQLPWVTADGQVMPFPTGVQATFTVNAAGSFPTSEPGADCCYNGHPASECLGGVNMNDDPPAALCTPTGAGNDFKGKIVRTIGNSSPDTNGIQFRLTTPELSTTWTDGQSPPGTCADGSTYDDGELLVSQIVLKAEPTSAGASGAFVDMNGDGCRRAGSGFIAHTTADNEGTITIHGRAA